MTQVFGKPQTFYDSFERKGGPEPAATHYCPGCGHGTVHKLMAEAIDELGVRDRTVLISPVGCSVFAYYYFHMGNIQAAHGRAPAVATGVKRARPGSIVISYQGDGDLAAIGFNNIMQAANRGEQMTVIFINNAIYGMTGGQMAPTTLIGQRTTTTPTGRTTENEGFPIGMCELVSTLPAPVYVERVALASPKLTMKARKAIRRALESQINGKGFSFVEILSQCPTGWKVNPVESMRWIEEQLMPVFPLKKFRDETENAAERRPAVPNPTPERVRQVVFPPPSAAPTDGKHASAATAELEALLGGGAPPLASDMRVKVAGFGGQGILYMGETLAYAGMRQGYQVSWLPSYGPEMRGGTAHCHVTVSPQVIGSPLVEASTHLVAMNRPSLERFIGELVAGGMVLYDSSLIDIEPPRDDVEGVAIPATETADRLGSTRVANMVMLGALVARAGNPHPATTLEALASSGGKAALLELNRQAIIEGIKLASG